MTWWAGFISGVACGGLLMMALLGATFNDVIAAHETRSAQYEATP